MILDNFFKNLIYEPVSVLGLLVFYFLLINLPISLGAVFKKKSSSAVRLITILVNLLITLQLLFRWSISGHFPISNLYESLYFLTWGITLGQLLVEREYQAPIIPAIAIPIELLTVAFACFVLPEDLKLSSNLVPALRSSWLVMHVSVVMLSYAALIIGSLLSMSVLFINKNKPLQIRSSSTGIGGFKLSNSYSVNDLVEPIELLTVAFACFVLPEDLKLSSNLVPALRSSWLVMHVSVVMLSYAALIVGSLLSISVLFINKNKPLQIRSSSTGIGGFKMSNNYPLNDFVEPIEFSHSEELDLSLIHI